MYADNITDSMKEAIEETERRRAIQMEYNKKNGIIPTTIKKPIRDIIRISNAGISKDEINVDKDAESMSRVEMEKEIVRLEKKMKKAAAELNFEEAMELRDRLVELKKGLLDLEQI